MVQYDTSLAITFWKMAVKTDGGRQSVQSPVSVMCLMDISSHFLVLW